MSWVDPCMQCHELRYACECIIEPKVYTPEELENSRFELEKNKKICSEIGHEWEYIFIVSKCKRCGELTDY